MKIVVDAMGGDDAPGSVIEGAVKASTESKMKIVLLGPEVRIKTELDKYSFNSDKIEICHTPQIIKMDESPARALRKKEDSSIVTGAKLVKEGTADAFVSAGNTGAVMAAATLKIGRISGVERPAIAAIFPSLKGQTLLLDAGANADSKAQNLVQQALMGQIYADEILHHSHPQVGLLSIGEEKEKGNHLTKEVYPRLEANENIDFAGNVEGRDIFTGEYSVIVCDGFVGNVVLKTTEGLVSAIFEILKQEIKSDWRSKLGGWLLKPALKRVGKKLDYAEYGGAPLLGVNGVTIIGHGSSSARAIANAIKTAEESINVGLIELIKEKISEGTDE